MINCSKFNKTQYNIHKTFNHNLFQKNNTIVMETTQHKTLKWKYNNLKHKIETTQLKTFNTTL